ncbi:response regulator transcription factor [Massilia sp. LXY-6]|uniref:response regulator n=1 Tax=Massilia sp. LXY-6 TaxID=3379823 RepID=UPI003EE0C04D
MIKICIADRHEIMRRRVKMLLDCVPGLQVAAEAGDAGQTLACVREGYVDVLLLDPSLPPYDDILLVQQIRDEAPELKILILSKNNDDQYLSRLLRAGADAYVAKTSELNQLITAIKVAASATRQRTRSRSSSLSLA